MFRSLVAGAIMLATTAGCTQTPSDPVEDASPALSDAAAPEAANEVVVKRGGAPSVDDRVWAAWTNTDDGLAALWSEFGQTAATQPDLGERPVVLVATIESGSCPITIHDVSVDNKMLEIGVAESLQDRPCTADARPVTFVLSPEGEGLRPPFVVKFGTTLVQVDEPDTLAAANRGEGDDWELLRPVFSSS